MVTALVYLSLLIKLTAGNFIQFGIYEFYFGNDSFNYSDAEVECLKKNATLAIINTKEISDFISNYIQNVPGDKIRYWIGLRRVNQSNVNSSFHWIDGTSLTQTFSNWDRNVPDNEQNECVIIMKENNSTWNDVKCTLSPRPLCQRKVRFCNESNNACGQNAHCDDSSGYIRCICDKGYQGDGFTTCTDIDECETTSTSTSGDASCFNTAGSFYCKQGQVNNSTGVVIASVGGLIVFAVIVFVITYALHKKWKAKTAINELYANPRYTPDAEKNRTKENHTEHLNRERISNIGEYENAYNDIGELEVDSTAAQEDVYNNVIKPERNANNLNTTEDATYDILRKQ